MILIENRKLEQFPLERLYFLESKEFLDLEEKIYLKENNSFKLNSFYLGISKKRTNNDKMLYLYNGLRSYYDVKSRFAKNPVLMETKLPIPMSKKSYLFFYKRKKYKYQSLIIFSLKKFMRPTITLTKDLRSDSELYHFPYKLLTYLNVRRRNLVSKANYREFRKNYLLDLRTVTLKLWINRYRYNKTSYRRLSFEYPKALGYQQEIIQEFNLFSQRKKKVFSKISKRFLLKVRFNRRRIRFRQRCYKTKKLLQLFLFSKRRKFKTSFKFKKTKLLLVPKLKKLTLLSLAANKLKKVNFFNIIKKKKIKELKLVSSNYINLKVKLDKLFNNIYLFYSKNALIFKKKVKWHKTNKGKYILINKKPVLRKIKSLTKKFTVKSKKFLVTKLRKKIITNKIKLLLRRKKIKIRAIEKKKQLKIRAIKKLAQLKK